MGKIFQMFSTELQVILGSAISIAQIIIFFIQSCDFSSTLINLMVSNSKSILSLS